MTRAEAKAYRNKVVQGEQDNPVGTQNNPFEWTPGMKLILNGYYTYNGKRYVAIADGRP